MTIGTRLREERKRLSLTQAEFAKAGGIGVSSLKMYEADERDPGALFLGAVANIGADAQYILTGDRTARFAEIGERLSGERRRLGMSAQYMAEAGGCTIEQQGAFECGQERPPAEYLNRLARHGIETHWVLFGTDELDAVRDKECPPYTPEIRKMNEDFLMAEKSVQDAAISILKISADNKRREIADFKKQHGASCAERAAKITDE